MPTRIIIARHGNTFHKGEVPTRVGAKTDLPLVEEKRARNIGSYLMKHQMLPQVIYASPLLRTLQTAQLILDEIKLDAEVIPAPNFIEIDYGPDENKTENEVLLRLGAGDLIKGQFVLDAWNNYAVVPSGWNVDPREIIDSWFNFAEDMESEYFGCNILLVSSNGIIRFSPFLTGDFNDFSAHHDIKVSTGGICVFEKEKNDDHWKCIAWNSK